jgi:type III restriction enzyme
LDEFSWNLDQCAPTLSVKDFSIELNVGKRTEVGVSERGGVRIGGVEEVIVRQMSFVTEGEDWSKRALVRWLDAELHRGEVFQGLTKAESEPWLLRVVDHLLTDRRADLPILARKRHDLVEVVRRRIAEHGRQQVAVAANMLIRGLSPRRLETSMDAAKVLDEQDYCPYRQYRGPFSYPKHAFDLIGEMGKDEEPECAKLIDDHPNVRRWVRNLTHESAGGYSLPLSPGSFYPDFIVELLDDRIAIVEYKGKQRADLPEEQHKHDTGTLWAERSGGKCVFVWVVDRDWQTLEAGLAAVQT